MYTNKTRMTGLSGIDTDTLVKQLMRAESVKYNRLKANNVLLSWKQEAYRNVASTMDTFRKTFLDFTQPTYNLRSNATFGGYTASAKISGTDTTKAKVTATSEAKAGTYRLDVDQLATKSSYTSSNDTLNYGGEIQSSGRVDISKLQVGDSFKITLDGLTKTITLGKEQLGDAENSIPATINSVEDLQSFLQDEVERLFGTDTGGAQKITVSTDGVVLSFSTTKGHEMKISQGNSRNTAQIGTTYDPDSLTDGGEYTFKVQIGETEEGITVDVKLEAGKGKEIAYLVSKINEAIGKDEDLKNKLSASVYTETYTETDGDGVETTATRQSVRFTNNTGVDDIKLSDTGTNGFLESIGFDSEVNIEHTNPMKDLGFTSGASTNLNTSKTIAELGLDGVFVDGDNNPITSGTVKINGVDIEFDVNKSLQTFINAVNNSAAGVTVTFDNVQRKFTMESKEAGIANEIKEVDAAVMNLFGFDKDAAGDVNKKAEDALIRINGVATTRSSNNFEINGLRIQLNEITTIVREREEDGGDGNKITVEDREDNPIIIEVSKDTSKGLDAIKKFVDEYNKLIESLNGQVNTTRAKKDKYSYYEPLTDDEKNAMSDTQIQQWEDKAKQGILYRDNIISGITSSLRSALTQSVEVSDGVMLSLYSIGIDTSSNWNEGGKLVIKDEDKLRKALEENGENVAKLFTKAAPIGSTGSDKMDKSGLAVRMENIMNEAIGSRGSIALQAGLKGTHTYGDNVIQKQMTKQSERLTEMLNALVAKETYYYNMFSKMEAAMNQSNSQMAYLQTQLGS